MGVSLQHYYNNGIRALMTDSSRDRLLAGFTRTQNRLLKGEFGVDIFSPFSRRQIPLQAPGKSRGKSLGAGRDDSDRFIETSGDDGPIVGAEGDRPDPRGMIGNDDRW